MTTREIEAAAGAMQAERERLIAQPIGRIYAQLATAALAAADKAAWRPIEEAPKDGTPVLCFRPDDQFSPVTGLDVLWFEPSIRRWLYNGEPVWLPPTHFRLLPSGPGAAE